MSRAPGTCMIEGAFQPSKVMSAYRDRDDEIRGLGERDHALEEIELHAFAVGSTESRITSILGWESARDRALELHDESASAVMRTERMSARMIAP